MADGAREMLEFWGREDAPSLSDPADIAAARARALRFLPPGITLEDLDKDALRPIHPYFGEHARGRERAEKYLGVPGVTHEPIDASLLTPGDPFAGEHQRGREAGEKYLPAAEAAGQVAREPEVINLGETLPPQKGPDDKPRTGEDEGEVMDFGEMEMEAPAPRPAPTDVDVPKPKPDPDIRFDTGKPRTAPKSPLQRRNHLVAEAAMTAGKTFVDKTGAPKRDKIERVANNSPLGQTVRKLYQHESGKGTPIREMVTEIRRAFNDEGEQAKAVELLMGLHLLQAEGI